MPKGKQDTLISLQLAAFFGKKKAVYKWYKSALECNLSWLWDVPGDSLLHHASRAGDSVTVETLLHDGSELSAKNKHGHTALWVAAQAGHVQTVETLLKYKISEGKLPDGDDAILATRSVNIVRAVLAIAPLAAMGRSGAKALKQVSREGNSKMVQCLLEAGANPNAGDDLEWQFPDLIPNSWGVPGDRALHWAARAGQLTSVELLINGGASILTTNQKSESALEVAAIVGASDVVKLLLSSGAEHQEGQMKRALRGAKTAEVAEILAEAIVQYDGGGDMVWMSASEGQHFMLKALVNAGAHLNSHFFHGTTPLHAAICKSHSSCIKLLLNGGADVNARDKSGRTPLHEAAALGDTLCVGALLSAGARRGARDRNWKIPRDYTKDSILYELLSHKRKVKVS